MGVHVFPFLTPLPPLSPSHPSGSSQCTSSEHPVSFIEPVLAFVSHVIIYMFQCHSPESAHPLPLPQNPKDCSIHLHVFCSLTYWVILNIFLKSTYIYTLVYCFGVFSFWLTSLCIIGSISSTSLELIQMYSLSWLGNIPFCICTSVFSYIHLLMGIFVASMCRLL